MDIEDVHSYLQVVSSTLHLPIRTEKLSVTTNHFSTLHSHKVYDMHQRPQNMHTPQRDLISDTHKELQ